MVTDVLAAPCRPTAAGSVVGDVTPSMVAATALLVRPLAS